MATWKRLHRTGDDNNVVDVNLDNVLHMHQYGEYTILHFAASSGAADNRRLYTLNVKETPDQIHGMGTLATH
jgi:hypothetical protein